ncbi:MAG: hypothetical protein HYV27_19595 [Candidatus Hydrogenedentes bacterium]|nr:hypothetical protein [Candidatus Hydrogenedentota bacterium]
MADELDAHVADLANAKAGWVTRRDAAEALGEAAKKALAALHAHSEDPDRDVQATVLKALQRTGAGGGLPGASADALPNTPEYTFEELIGGLAFKDRRVVAKLDTGCRVDLIVESERKQSVYVTPHENKEGASMIRIYTRCGAATPEAIAWAMRTNAHLLDCSFAILKEKEEDLLILINNIERIYATPARVKSVVKEIARYGDYLEKKLAAKDSF